MTSLPPFNPIDALHALPDSIIIIDERKYIAFLNNAACDLFHISLDAVVGQPLTTLSDALAAFEDQTNYLGEVQINGRLSVLRISPLTYPSLPGCFPGSVFTIIEPEKEIRFSLGRHDFISLIVHELRAPMTSIRGYADLLLQHYLDPLTDKQHQAVQVIQTVAKRMMRLTNYLLTAERLRLGRIKVAPEPVNPQTLIAELLENDTVRQAQCAMSCSWSSSSPTVLTYLDPLYAHDMFEAIVDYAVLQCPKGVTINVTSAQDDQTVQITFHLPDPSNELAAHFMRLCQQSWGEPVAVAAGLAELHGGRIWAEYAAVSVCCIYIILPKGAA
jgi:signal transduction histidine kinase